MSNGFGTIKKKIGIHKVWAKKVFKTQKGRRIGRAIQKYHDLASSKNVDCEEWNDHQSVIIMEHSQMEINFDGTLTNFS